MVQGEGYRSQFDDIDQELKSNFEAVQDETEAENKVQMTADLAYHEDVTTKAMTDIKNLDSARALQRRIVHGFNSGNGLPENLLKLCNVLLKGLNS